MKILFMTKLVFLFFFSMKSTYQLGSTSIAGHEALNGSSLRLPKLPGAPRDCINGSKPMNKITNRQGISREREWKIYDIPEYLSIDWKMRSGINLWRSSNSWNVLAKDNDKTNIPYGLSDWEQSSSPVKAPVRRWRLLMSRRATLQ